MILGGERFLPFWPRGAVVGDIDVLVDLKARQNVVSVNLEAPKDKGGKGRGDGLCASCATLQMLW